MSLVKYDVFKETTYNVWCMNVCLQCLREALARHQGRKDDGHVAAFALFELASIYMTKPEVSNCQSQI